MFSLICAWTNGWVNNRHAGDLRRHRAHYYVTPMTKHNSAIEFPQKHPVARRRRWATECQFCMHYSDVIVITMASQITSLTIVYSTVYSGTDQRKHQSSASLAFVRGIHRWPVNSPHNGQVTRKMLPFYDVIMFDENASFISVQHCISKKSMNTDMILLIKLYKTIHIRFWLFLASQTAMVHTVIRRKTGENHHTLTNRNSKLMTVAWSWRRTSWFYRDVWHTIACSKS